MTYVRSSAIYGDRSLYATRTGSYAPERVGRRDAAKSPASAMLRLTAVMAGRGYLASHVGSVNNVTRYANQGIEYAQQAGQLLRSDKDKGNDGMVAVINTTIITPLRAAQAAAKLPNFGDPIKWNERARVAAMDSFTSAQRSAETIARAVSRPV